MPPALHKKQTQGADPRGPRGAFLSTLARHAAPGGSLRFMTFR